VTRSSPACTGSVRAFTIRKIKIFYSVRVACMGSTLAAAARAAAKATAARKKGRDKVGSDDELENVRVKLLQHRTKNRNER
jgi:hypothetical protein